MQFPRGRGESIIEVLRLEGAAESEGREPRKLEDEPEGEPISGFESKIDPGRVASDGSRGSGPQGLAIRPVAIAMEMFFDPNGVANSAAA